MPWREGIKEHHVSELVLKELEVNRTSGRRRGPVEFREGLFFLPSCCRIKKR
jgi:hypothetical protein